MNRTDIYMDIPPVLTMKQFTELIGCNVDYGHKLRKAGVVRFMKLGSWKISRAEIIRFLEDSVNKDLTDPSHIVEFTERNL